MCETGVAAHRARPSPSAPTGRPIAYCDSWGNGILAGDAGQFGYNGATMEQKTRERIALIVFLVLIAGTLFGIVAYLHIGHSWNQAATSIDDASGDMKGYTAIVYRGIDIPTAREAKSEAKPVSPVSVTRGYREKGADVLRVDVLHPENYDGEDIYYIGGRRIGVFYAPSTMTSFAIERHAAWFTKHGVDFTICIADDMRAVSMRNEGIDIVILRSGGEELHSGSTIEDTYYVNAPCVGRAGVLLVSPDGIVSYKDISNESS